MLKLAKIIREGLRIKRAWKEKPGRVEVPEENLKVKPVLLVTPQAKIKAEPIFEEYPLAEAISEVKEEAESSLSSINKEIESLNLTVDEEGKIYRIGSLSTLNFKDLGGCNPVMSADRIEEAVKKSLLKKYDVEPAELEKKLQDFKKKFRSFGTHCYLHVLKQEIYPVGGKGEA